MYIINEIREALRNYLSKINRNMLSVDEFNSACQYVNSKIIRESLNYIDKIKSGKKRGNYGKTVYNRENMYKEVAKNLLKDAILTYNGTNFDYPNDYSMVRALYTSTGREIEQLEAEERFVIVHEDTLPTENYPVYLEHGDYVEVLPDTITSGVTMYYYKQSPLPNWTYTVVGTDVLFNPSASDFVDFSLPESVYDEILREMLLYVSGELKQPDIAQLMQSEEQKSEQLKYTE